MHETVITNSDELFSKIHRFKGGICRGVERVEYQLLPKIYRESFQPRSHVQKLTLEKFKGHAIPYLTWRPSSDWEWVALAQHYGVPTRLLDWSQNPFVATFFAVAAKEACDCAVYISTADIMEEPVDADLYPDPFDIPRILFLRPPHVTTRISAQSGVFTVHPDPEKSTHKQKLAIEKLVIPAKLKHGIQMDLNRYGINYSTVYPDLQGVGNHIAWCEEIFYKSIVKKEERYL